MRCDMLIIGAGPAGTTLARQLAQAGFDVVIVDKKAFPRAKPCGEFLSPECAPLLARLGLGDLLSQLGAQRVERLAIHGDGKRVVGSLRRLAGGGEHARQGFGIRRETLDHALLSAAIAAGARFYALREFVSLLRDARGTVTGATLRTPDGMREEWHASTVVGADGVRSRVARALGVQRRLEWLDQFALVAHHAGVPESTTAEVHLLDRGYFAATTVDDGLLSVNLVLPRQHLRERAEGSWDDFVAANARAAPAFAVRLAPGRRLGPWRGTGPFAFTTRRCCADGAALVGDAAGYVDPLTGEGLYFALFAARALGDSLEAERRRSGSRALALRRYQRARTRELAPRLLAAKVLQRGLRHPWVVRGLMGAMLRWPRLADLLVTLSGDTIHPRDLWRPSLWRELTA